MRAGKVTDTILKRSVINLIDYKNDKVLFGAGIGHDCSVIEAGDRYVLTSTEVAVGDESQGPMLAVIKAANNIAACGGAPISASAAFVLPCKNVDVRLKALTRNVLTGCRMCGVQLAGGHTELSDNVTKELVTITVTGTCDRDSLKKLIDVKSGMDIVVSKWIGIEGTVIMLREHYEELRKTLPESYISRAADFKDWLSIMNEAAVALRYGVTAMHDISDGGIFAALWDLSECAKTGITVDLKAIPVKQETIEFSEVLGVNPYRMKSSGSLIMVTEDGIGLVKALEAVGIPAAVIGRTTDDNDKKILNGEEVRYLEKP